MVFATFGMGASQISDDDEPEEEMPRDKLSDGRDPGTGKGLPLTISPGTAALLLFQGIGSPQVDKGELSASCGYVSHGMQEGWSDNEMQGVLHHLEMVGFDTSLEMVGFDTSLEVVEFDTSLEMVEFDTRRLLASSGREREGGRGKERKRKGRTGREGQGGKDREGMRGKEEREGERRREGREGRTTS